MSKTIKTVTHSKAQKTEATLAEAVAIKALAEGTASEWQQKQALHWIMTVAAMQNLNAFFPESPMETAYAMGRKYVAEQIVGLIKDDLSKFKETDNANR
jgi:hypothetical protein